MKTDKQINVIQNLTINYSLIDAFCRLASAAPRVSLVSDQH